MSLKLNKEEKELKNILDYFILKHKSFCCRSFNVSVFRKYGEVYKIVDVHHDTTIHYILDFESKTTDSRFESWDQRVNRILSDCKEMLVSYDLKHLVERDVLTKYKEQIARASKRRLNQICNGKYEH